MAEQIGVVENPKRPLADQLNMSQGYNWNVNFIANETWRGIVPLRGAVWSRGYRMSAQLDHGIQTPPPQSGTTQQITTLIVGLLLGVGLGLGVFLAAGGLEWSGDLLLSFVVGAFLAFSLSLAVSGFLAVLIVPRFFASASGTLTGMVDDLTRASQAYAVGDSAKALSHMGRAAEEGVAWYSIGATKRFVVHAALGLLVTFGSITGAVLLLSQNSLLREQNKKIDLQTAVTDAQKRGAFASELFAIVQDVAKLEGQQRRTLPEPLMARILVLMSSAKPYLFLEFPSSGAPQRIRRPLSPERGQMLTALARLNVNLSTLITAGVEFDGADLRQADLQGVDLSKANLSGSNLSGANLRGAKLVGAQLINVEFDKVHADSANFSEAALINTYIREAHLRSAIFDRATLSWVVIENTWLDYATFNDTRMLSVKFARAGILKSDLPAGLPWPKSIVDSFARRTEGAAFTIEHELTVVR
jgi:hypothetical protein